MQKRMWGLISTLVGLALVLGLVGGAAPAQAAPLAARPILYNIAPVEGQTVSTSDGKVRVGATIQSDQAITGYQVLIDDVAVNFPPPVYQNENRTLLLYSFVPLANGQHRAYIVGTNQDGEQGGYAWNFSVTGGPANPPSATPILVNPTATPIRVNPTTTPGSISKQPVIDALTPANGATVGGQVVRLGFNISSSATIVGRNLSLDNRNIQYTREGGGNRETIYVNVTGLSVGAHTLQADASDSAGRFNSLRWTFTYNPAGPPLTATPGNAGNPCLAGTWFFPQTGRCVREVFYRYWQRNGALTTFGYPLSPELQEVSDTDGRTYAVQYFERARFEYHPENAGTNFEVLLGLIGTSFHPVDPPVPARQGRTYFQQTGHNVAPDFYNFWVRNGGLAILGLPISEEFNETIDGRQYTVQYFERARFERHPENAAPFNILLGQLARQLYQQRYPNGQPTGTDSRLAPQPGAGGENVSPTPRP